MIALQATVRQLLPAGCGYSTLSYRQIFYRFKNDLVHVQGGKTGCIKQATAYTSYPRLNKYIDKILAHSYLYMLNELDCGVRLVLSYYYWQGLACLGAGTELSLVVDLIVDSIK